ncbi:hypothetical protein, partial [Cognatishimia sp.]|uniref:hypothetical protein n=1 Tax=Cognatishimia sp. TaxID=2211648 RepID=UPI003511E3DF
NHHTDGSEANDALTIKLDQSDEAAQRRAVLGKKAQFEPHPWVYEVKTGQSVPFGEPSRHTDRTFGPPEALMRLFERYSEDLNED